MIDKPGGITSHDVVARARRVLAMKKIGHAGTLDPLATGLLILAAGRFTRLIRFVQDLEKEYVADVQFGVATDTLDADGAVLSRTPMEFGADDLAAVVPRFIGTVHQVPPMVSALKVGGRRLYDIARSGETVERDARPVLISELEVVGFVPGPYPEATIRVRCGKGTYVRTLADDLGQALGGHASLTALRRTANGHLSVSEAVDLAAWEASEDPWASAIDPLQVVGHLPVTRIDAGTADAVRNGVRLVAAALPGDPPDGLTAMVGPDGTLLAVYRKTQRQAVPEVVVS